MSRGKYHKGLCACGGPIASGNHSRCLACHAAAMREWRKTHKLTGEAEFRARVRAYANVAKRRGKLVPQPCQWCGSPDVQMHHPDYSKPLAVEWLCKPCHKAFHDLRGVSAPTPSAIEGVPRENISTSRYRDGDVLVCLP